MTLDSIRYLFARGRWALLLLGILIGGGGAAAYALNVTPTYQSSTQIFVSVSKQATAAQYGTLAQWVQNRVQSYVSLATSTDVLNTVRQKLKNPPSADALAGEISANAPLDKALINIVVTDSSAQRAYDIATQTSAAFIHAVQSIDYFITSGSTPVNAVSLTVIQPAKVATAPIAPRKTFIVVLGALGGLLVALVALIVRERFDTRLRSRSDIQALVDRPVLGSVATARKAGSRPLQVLLGSEPGLREAFRNIRTNLRLGEGDLRSIAVTSAAPAEGRTFIALNLAAALAQAHHSVCLVEADFRAPTLAGKLGIEGREGLASVLRGTADVGATVLDAGQGVHVLVAGTSSADDSDLLNSARLRDVLGKLATRFDYVVLDAAALLTVAEGVEVAAASDATLLVVRAGRTKEADVLTAVQRIELVGGTVAGIVLNQDSKKRAATVARVTSVPPRRPAPAAPAPARNGARQAEPDDTVVISKGLSGLAGRSRRANRDG